MQNQPPNSGNNGNYPQGNPTLAPPQYSPGIMYPPNVQPQYSSFSVPMQSLPIQTSLQPQQVLYYQPQAVVPMFHENIASSQAQPLLTPSENFAVPLKQRLIERHYSVDLTKWLGEGWNLYKQNWAAYSLFTLFYILISAIPYVGSFLALGLYPGVYIAGMHQLRPNTGFNGRSLFHGYFFYVPLLLTYFVYALAIFVGFFLLIIPGFYFAVVLSFAPYIYLEYHHEHIGIMDAFTISRKALTKQFCTIFLFFIVIYLTNIVGFCFFIIGILVSLPVTQLSCAVAFRDMFGLCEAKGFDDHCVYC